MKITVEKFVFQLQMFQMKLTQSNHKKELHKW